MFKNFKQFNLIIKQICGLNYFVNKNKILNTKHLYNICSELYKRFVKMFINFLKLKKPFEKIWEIFYTLRKILESFRKNYKILVNLIECFIFDEIINKISLM